MENYIKVYFETLTALYPDIDFYACDVVNEAWLEDGKCRKPGANVPGGAEEGHSPWVQVYGDNSFIEYAFTFARKYAPKGCKLYYNDYSEYVDNKMKAIAEMAADFKEKGIIDAIYAHRDNISALIFWGVTDDRSRRSSGQPLIFDRACTAKPAFYSIIGGHNQQVT